MPSIKTPAMKYSLLLLALACCLNVHAQDTARQERPSDSVRHVRTRDSAHVHDSKPWDYIMMKHGQLIEVTKGVKTPVTYDVVLVNESTIHPDGTINDSNGKTKHLKEGKYITMDGRIRNLRRLPAGLPPQ